MTTTRDKNTKFLGMFWDLASEEQEKRLKACQSVLQYVHESEKALPDSAMSQDCEYALKRLVRGLASSRECARQGFATCLCELIKISSVAISATLVILDENTRITGSLKGQEERDYLFGKLFGYMACIRSNKLHSNEIDSIDMYSRLVELHTMKPWLREVVTETLLLLIASVNHTIACSLIAKTASFLNDPTSEMTAWQLMFALGLQQLADAHELKHKNHTSTIGQAVRLVLGNKFHHIFSNAAELNAIAPTLIQSTSGFPKIHRVWDYLMGSIFGMTVDRQLPQKRVTALTPIQEELLLAFTTFIDQHLINCSNEKRGVGLKLTIELVRVCPADVIPLTVSHSVVKCLIGVLVNKKHLLYGLARSAVSNMVAAAGVSAGSRLALASVLLHHGGAAFDDIVGVDAVGRLLDGLDNDAIASHTSFLCSMIGSSSAASVTAAKSDKTAAAAAAGDDDMEEVEEEENDGGASAACSALDALYQLAKNPRISHTRHVGEVALVVCLRFALFGAGDSSTGASGCAAAEDKATPSKNKKSKASKNKKDEEVKAGAVAVVTVVAGLSAPHREALTLAEKGASNSANSASSSSLFTASFSAALTKTASARFMTLITDAFHHNLHEQHQAQQLQHKTSDSSSSSSSATTAAAATIDQPHQDNVKLALATLRQLITQSQLSLYIASRCDQQDAALGQHNIATLKVLDTIDSLSAGADSESAMDKLKKAFAALLAQALFLTLSSTEISLQVVLDIASCAVKLTTPEDSHKATISKAKSSAADDEEDDVEEGEDNVQCMLFDTSMDLLSLSVQHNLRGVREAVKRVWALVCQLQAVDDDLVNMLIETIVADDVEEEQDEEEEEDNDAQNDEVDGDDEDAVAADSKKEPKPPKFRKPKQTTTATATSTAASEKNNSDDDEDDDEDEEVLFKSQQALQLLTGEEDLLDAMSDDDDDEEEDNEDGGDNEDGEGFAQHTAEADDAFVAMIQQRKQSRKQGLLNAKKQQFVVRTRALDMLEVVLSKCDVVDVLFPIFVPLLSCLRVAQSSGLLLSLPEGRAFEQRLRTLLDQKLFKKKFSLIADGSEEAHTNILEEVVRVSARLVKDLRCPHAGLRHTAHCGFLATTRAVLTGDCEDAKNILSSCVRRLHAAFATKKNSRISPKLFDDLLQRYPDFMAQALLDGLLRTCADDQSSPFLRAECVKQLEALFKATKPSSSSSSSSSSSGSAGQQLLTSSWPRVLSVMTCAVQRCEIAAAALTPTPPSSSSSSSSSSATADPESAGSQGQGHAAAHKKASLAVAVKRCRGLLTCCKSALLALKQMSVSVAPGSETDQQLRALKGALASESAVMCHTAALAQLSSQVVAAVDAVPVIIATAASDNKKAKKPKNSASAVDQESNKKKKNHKEHSVKPVKTVESVDDAVEDVVMKNSNKKAKKTK